MKKDYTTKRCINVTNGKVKFVPAWITQDAELMKKHNLILQDYEKKELSLNEEVETAIDVQSDETANEVQQETTEKKRRRRK